MRVSKQPVKLLLLLLLSFCAAQDEECTVGPDGSCLKDESVPLLLEAESVPADDYIDTGFGEKQLSGGAQADDTRQRVGEIVTYMKERVLTAEDTILKSVASECRLRDELCAFWAAIGECEANPGTLLCAGLGVGSWDCACAKGGLLDSFC